MIKKRLSSIPKESNELIQPMARQLRLEFPGGVYHVTSRGDGREDIYLSDVDKIIFLSILGVACERFHWHCHSYCLMDNHYHLLIETPLGNLSKGMHYINGVYTQKFNRAHGRVGHVFQGRYKAILVEKDAYLLELARYIVLNPVRAGMIHHASEWRWSSYRAICGDVQAPAWLTVDWILSQFASSRAECVTRYRVFVDAGQHKNPWDGLKNHLYLGSDKFATKMIGKIKCDQSLIDISKPQYTQQMNVLSLSEYEQSSASRNQAIVLAFKSCAYTLKEIGVHFGLHYSSISRIIRGEHANFKA